MLVGTMMFVSRVIVIALVLFFRIFVGQRSAGRNGKANDKKKT